MSEPARAPERRAEEPFPWVAVTVFFTAATIWMTRPLAWRAAHALARTCDTYLTAWILSWDVHALFTRPKHLFDANIFYPMKGALALSEHMLGNVPLFAPIATLTGNPVLGLNAVILASFVLCGVTMAHLVHGWTGRLGAGLVAGFMFAFVPYRVSQLDHMQLLSLQWLPLAVHFADRLLRIGDRRAWIGFTGFTLWQCLVSYYLAYLTLLVLGVFCGLLLWRRRHTVSRRQIAALLAGVAVVAAVMVPLTVPYARLGSRGIIARFTSLDVFKENPYAMALADPVWSYLTLPADTHSIYARLLTTHSPVLDWEKALFQGFLPLIVIGLALVVGRRSTLAADVVVPLVGVLIAAYTVSLGPFLVWNEVQTSVRLPAYWVAVTVPGLASIRAWPRFGFGVTFALAALTGIAVARLTARASSHARIASSAALLLGLALEYGVAPLPVEDAPPPATPAHSWLAAHASRKEAILILPANAPPCVQARYMYHTLVHWLPLGTGYSGHMPRAAGENTGIAIALPAPEAIARARSRGFRWLVMERDAMTPADRAAFEAAEESRRLARAATFAGETIYDLDATFR